MSTIIAENDRESSSLHTIKSAANPQKTCLINDAAYRRGKSSNRHRKVKEVAFTCVCQAQTFKGRSVDIQCVWVIDRSSAASIVRWASLVFLNFQDLKLEHLEALT